MVDRTLSVLVLTAILAAISWNSAHAASPAARVDLPLDAWQFNAADNWSDANAPPTTGAAWVPLTQALSRQWQLKHPRNRGGEVWYRFELSNVKDLRRDAPWVLEFTYPKTIQQVLLDGRPLKDISSATVGRGQPGKTFYLPPKDFANAKQILVKVSDYDYRYASHFGRASLRPMEPFERFFIEELRPISDPEAAPAISLNLTNLSGEPTAAQVVAEVYEYFGQLLRTETYDFATGSGGVALKTKTPRDYRVLLRVKAGDSLSTPYWGYFRGAAERAEENEFRTVNVLRGGRAAWSYRWVKESEGFNTPLPADAWSDKIPITGMWYYDEPGLPFWFRTQNIPTHRIWFKRTADIPADAAGKAVFVFLRDVCYKVDLYVDGKPAGTRMQYELPDRIDITKFVTPGKKCELQFAVTDAIVCRAPDSGTLKDGRHANSNFIAPAPSRDANIGFTVWPEVHITPRVLTEHSLVRATFKPRKQIEYHTIIRNATDKPVELEVVREILLRGKPVKTLPPEKVTVPPGQFTTDAKAEAWPDTVEWTLDNPELYTLRTTLRQIGPPGQPLDVHQLRFGFRELAIDGTNFTLNGKIIRPYGATLSCVGYGHHPEFMNFARLDRVAFNSFRWFFPDMADERGYFITWETTGWDPCGGGQYLAGDDRLYANNLSLWKRISLYSRQHPSIFCYTCSNEQPWIDKAVAAKMAKLLDDIAAFEPGRFAIHSRGANLYGQAKIDTPHYFYFYHMLPTDMLWFDVPGDKRPKEVRDRLAKDPGDVGYEGPQTEWWGRTPLFDSEGMSVTDGHEYMPWLVGDSVWVSGMNRPGRGPDLATDKMRAYMWSAVRQIRLSAVQAHHASMAGMDALHPTAVYFKTVEPRAYGGEPTTRDITVVNETSSPKDVHVTARLLDAVDHELWKFEHDSHLDIAGRDKLTLDLTMPKVDAPTYYQLELRTHTDGLPDYCESHRLTVFPRREIAWPDKVVLYDPAGQSAEVLRKHGFKGAVGQKLDVAALADIKLLLIGKGGTAALMPQAKVLQQAVARGLKVLVLPQTSIVDVFPRHVEDGENTSCSNGVVVASPSHPVLGGLREEDFLFWATPWRVPTTFENAPFMPVDPAVKPILIGGETRSWQLMGYSPLMEMRHGRGCYLICQMSVVRSMGLDPAADVLMNNMLAYLDSPASADPAPTRAAKVLPASGALAEMLRRENDVILVNDSAPDSGTIIVDGLSADGLAGLGGVKASVAGGAKLLVHGLDAQTLAALKDVFGLEVTLEDFPCSQAFRTIPSFVLEGMTNYDLQWEHTAGGLKGRKPSDLDVGRQRISVKAGPAGAAGAAVVYPMLPEYVAVVPFQKGVIVLDNVRWDKITSKRARRYAGSFLANLGCAFNFKQEETDAFANLSSFDLAPIDLAKFCNRGLADDEERGNGKGGWTDEGKGHDIGSLPVGRQTFAGVPFEVTDPVRNNGNGLIAFRGHSWSQLPTTAPEIPISRKIDKLYVLHAAAWITLEAGGELARIRVYYQDRKTWIPGRSDPFSVIPVKNQINITDWWGVGAVADGDTRVPQAKVAWLDSGTRRNRGIMAMEWTNPYPDKVVDAIEVQSTSDKAQYFLIALTTATRAAKAGAVATSQPVSRDVTESDPLPEGVKFQRGMKCVQAGQFRMYVAPCMAVPWLGCTDGRPLLKDLGWTLTTQTPGKADSYLTGNSGFPAGSKIPPLTVEERNGAIFVSAAGMPNRAFDWSGQYELTDSTIRVKYELTPREEIRKILDGKTPNLSAGCGVAPANRISGLALRNGDWGRGFFSVRTKAGTLIFNFTDRFTRYQKNVWWWDEGQGFGIPPRNLDWNEKGPDKAVIEYEIRLTGVTPIKD